MLRGSLAHPRDNPLFPRHMCAIVGLHVTIIGKISFLQVRSICQHVSWEQMRRLNPGNIFDPALSLHKSYSRRKVWWPYPCVLRYCEHTVVALSCNNLARQVLHRIEGGEDRIRTQRYQVLQNEVFEEETSKIWFQNNWHLPSTVVGNGL